MATSSNTIFHYTSNIQHLKSILSKGFYPSYCKETINTGNGSRSYAIPIISFCDIPLSQIKDHMDKYGQYAIGLSMDWAKKYGLNPVLYLERNSVVNNGVMGVMNFLHNDWHEILGEKDFDRFYDESYKGALSVLQTIKNYSGPLIRHGKDLGEYKFYDEREWRFTPVIHIDHVTDYPDIFWEQDFQEIELKFPAKPHFEDYNLQIYPEDIKYIIVSDPSEVREAIQAIAAMPSSFSSQEEYEHTLTKIMTAEQIREDF
jgi:hypothetical protein